MSESERTKRLYVPAPSGFGPLPFSNGVLVGDTFYTSGHIGFDPATKKIPDVLEREVECLMASLGDTLAKGGLGLDDLVYVQIFCPDTSLFERFNAVYRRYIKEPFPARAFIGSGRLLFEAHFEIQGIAVRKAVDRR
ncbi:MAG TPA: RidA family protein [Candidatus Acidoferrum sp.]|nr:RidA family protein [Candidatus Acidoferrum sp.]